MHIVTNAATAFSRWPRVPTHPLAVEPYFPLVRSIVADIARRPGLDDLGLDVRDLAGCGLVGLLQAARRFDPARGVAFSTFAAPRIRGAMLDAIRTGARWRRDANRAASDPARCVPDGDGLEAQAGAVVRLARATRRLPPCDIALVHGHYVEGRQLADLGERISRSPSQVCRRLARAISRIREAADLAA